MKDDDYVFLGEKPAGRQLTSNAVSQAFSKIVTELSLAKKNGGKPKDLRLYCLRKAFRKFMVVEEAYKEFWMCHTSTATHYVSRDPEYHRRLYAEGYDNLRLYKPDVEVEMVAKLTRENMELKRRLGEMNQRLRDIEVKIEEIGDIKEKIKREQLI